MRNASDNAKSMMAVIGVVFVMFFIILVVFRAPFLSAPARYDILTLNEWRGTVGEKHVREDGKILLDEYVDLHVRPGDVWEITTALPAQKLPAPVLFFHTLQAVVEVTFEGELIYSYGTSWLDDGDMIKRGICMVSLPENYMGKELTISFTATEPAAFSGVGPIQFGSEPDLLRMFVQERRVPLFFGVFLMVFALLQLLWMPYLLFREGASPRPLFGAFITLLAGLYILGYYHMFEIFTRLGAMSTMIEYLSLYLLPCAISAYFWTLMSGRLKTLYQYFIITDIAMIAIILMLQVLGMVHITSYLTVSYIITFLESLPYLLFTHGGVRSRSSQGGGLDVIADRIVYAGYLIFVICALTDMVFFTRAKYSGAGETTVGIPFITTGAILFTMALTAQYFIYGVSHLRADVTKEQLEHRAYTDPLTGLSNRIRSEQVMQQLKITEPFVIISMDMDGLKKVNDTLGHAEGDRMLSGFANALKKCFGDMTLVGRMGGDEFIVILTGEECAVLNAKLNELERALFDLNLDERRFYYSMSYGYANNQETHFGRRVRDIYMLADRRMYDMKRKRKQEQAAEAQT